MAMENLENQNSKLEDLEIDGDLAEKADFSTALSELTKSENTMEKEEAAETLSHPIAAILEAIFIKLKSKLIERVSNSKDEDSVGEISEDVMKKAFEDLVRGTISNPKRADAICRHVFETTKDIGKFLRKCTSEELQHFCNEIAELTIRDMKNGVIQFSKDTVETVLTAGNDAANYLKRQIKDGYNTVKDASISDIVGTGGKYVKKVGEKGGEYVEKVGKKGAKYVENGIKKGGEYVEKVGKKVKEGLNAVGNRF